MEEIENRNIRNSKNDIFDEDKFFAYFLFNISKSSLICEFKAIWGDYIDEVERFISIKCNTKIFDDMFSPTAFISDNNLQSDIDEIIEEDMFDSGRAKWARFLKSANVERMPKDEFEEYAFNLVRRKILEVLSKHFDFGSIDFNLERVNKIRDFAKLTEYEVKVLVFGVTINYFQGFIRFLGLFGPKTLIKVISACIGISQKEYVRAMASHGTLISTNIISEMQRIQDVPVPNQTYGDYIVGNLDDFIYEIATVKIPQNTYSLDSFKLPKITKEIVHDLLSAETPCKILFYGAPGSGKSEFAKSIVANLGKKIVTTKENADNDFADIIMMLKAAERLGEIAVVDECDNIIAGKLSGRPFSGNWKNKSAVNTAFDEVKGKSIWITNDIEEIEISTLRRFSFSIEFDGLNEEQKTAALESSIANLGLKCVDSSEVAKVAKRYSLSTAGISEAIRGATIVSNSRGSEYAIPTIKAIAKAQHALANRNSVDTQKYKSDRHFDSSIINMDHDYTRLMTVLKNYSEKLREDSVDSPMNLLFMGVAGSGKTELARHIAQKLERPIIVKRMSGLLSKYIGETEKGIANAFDEAERKGAVLIIDEADSLFANRATAERQWEISMTNEILAQMENHRGILICSTNLVERMDSAAMRRFHKKITFGYLTAESAGKLFSSYLLNGKEPSQSTKYELSKLDNLTAGDFKNVSQQITFEADSIPESECLRLIKKESELKSIQSNTKIIGFA